MGCEDTGASTGDVDNDCLKDTNIQNQLSVRLSNLFKQIKTKQKVHFDN